MIADRAVRRAFKIPDPVTSYQRSTTNVPMRDGAQLVTDVYVLRDNAPAKATVLIRSPYGRRFPLDLLHARVFAGSGYQVVVQSVRGRTGSTGSFRPMAQEPVDGQGTVAWLREQDWYSGRLATFGGSYLGFAQWALLTDPPADLQATVIVVGPHDFARQIYGSGAFTLGDMFGWSEAMTAPEGGNPLVQLSRAAAARRRAAPQLEALPLSGPAAKLAAAGARWYGEWLEHGTPADPFWDDYRALDAVKNSQVPTLLIGGWRDAFLDQTLEQYDALRGRDVEVALTIGPWTHMDTATKAAGHVTREALEWLDHIFTDAGPTRPAVRAFTTGADEWRDLDELPAAASELEFGLATGSLTDDKSDGQTSVFTYDPADPTPAVGGRVMDPVNAGRKDNRSLLRRTDVVSFTSAALSASVEVVGSPKVRLRVSVTNPHADVFVRLCEVDRRGRSWNIADGFVRLDRTVPTDEVQELDVPLDQCWHRVTAGHQLQLLVAGGAFPRFARNLGTDDPVATGTTMHVQPHTVHHDGSVLTLPIVSAG